MSLLSLHYHYICYEKPNGELFDKFIQTISCQFEELCFSDSGLIACPIQIIFVVVILSLGDSMCLNDVFFVPIVGWTDSDCWKPNFSLWYDL